jgi:DNA-binding NarL/FixJ family response regulator
VIRFRLADDQQLVRAGVRVLLEACGEIEVVGEAADGKQAAALALALQPEVVLMDIAIPGTGGL